MTTRAKPTESSGARRSCGPHLSPRPGHRFLPVRGWALVVSAALIAGSVQPALADGHHRQHGAHALHHVHAHAARGDRHAHRHQRHGHHWAHAATALLGLAVLSLAASPPRAVHYWHARPEARLGPRYRRIVHAVAQPRPHYHVTATAPVARWRAPAPLPRACLMIREYQTQAVVGGRTAEAYGDACLQSDGSWRLGPPKIAPR